MRGCVRLVAVVWCWLVRRPLPTHKRFLCPWALLACAVLLLVTPPPTLSRWLTWRSVVVMIRAEAFSHHHLDLRRSTCAPLCCSHVSQQVATRNCFRFLLLHGRWAACDRCDRGPRTPPIVLLAQKMSMSSASLCCRCTVSGVRTDSRRWTE